MKHNIRDYPCSPQDCVNGLEPGELEECYQNEHRILELAYRLKERNHAACLKLPFDDYVEAEVLGAQIIRSNHITQIQYPSEIQYPNEIEYSNGIQYPNEVQHPIDVRFKIREDIELCKVSPVKQLLEAIRLSDEAPLMLQVQAPFSILAYLMEPMKLYKKLLKKPEEVKENLSYIEKFLEGYIKIAIENGAELISISDPCASVEILGEENYRIYSAAPLLQLLQQLEPLLDRRIVHICPRCSYLMEQLGLIRSETLSVKNQNLQKALINQIHNTKLHFTGHQCIHQLYTDQIHQIYL